MLTLKMKQVKAPVWRGYTANTTGFLPRRMSWMEPAAADAFNKMMKSCDNEMEITDCYRSVLYQAQCIRERPSKRRLYAPPTKSGHNFGFSIDVKISDTLENFRNSGNSELVSVGRDRSSLVRWMKRFGWTGIIKESWHFNYLGEYSSTKTKIDHLHAPSLTLTNHELQEALNKLLRNKLDEPLRIDGILGKKTDIAGIMADRLLMTNDKKSYGKWFRRVLVGATAEIEEMT